MKHADDLLAVLRARRSVRAFTDAPVDAETIDRLVDAARWAPSASNRQDWMFYAVLSPDVKRRMAALVREAWDAAFARAGDTPVVEEVRGYSAAFDWFGEAPAVIAVTARDPEALLRHMVGEEAGLVAGSQASAAMAAQNLMLAAHAEGLATCCLTGALAAHDEIRKLLQVKGRRHIVCLIAVGYPAETPQAPPRRPLEEIRRVIR